MKKNKVCINLTIEAIEILKKKSENIGMNKSVWIEYVIRKTK